MKRLFLRSLYLLLIITAVSWWFNASLPIKDTLLSKKERSVSAYAEKINTLLVGASPVYRSFDPAQLDSLIHSAGIQTTTFNFGVPGMALLETEYILEKYLFPQLPNLKLLVLESKLFDPFEKIDNFMSWRMVRFHDFKRTAGAVSAILDIDTTNVVKYSKIQTRIRLFTKRSYLAGEGKGVLKSFLDLISPGKSNHTAPPTYNGFRALDTETQSTFTKRKNNFHLPENIIQFHAAVAKDINSDLSQPEDYPSQQIAIHTMYKIAEECEKRGIMFIVLATPGKSKKEKRNYVLNKLQSSSPAAIILRMDSPLKYPAFYQVENRFDAGHLNLKGARIATRELANLLIPLLKGQSGLSEISMPGIPDFFHANHKNSQKQSSSNFANKSTTTVLCLNY